MRGLKKPWQPKDVRPKGWEPQTLQQAEADFLAELPEAKDKAELARSTFDNHLEKKKLREVLYVEQGELCVFCEGRVAESVPFPPIDHWRPLNQNPELALHWRNLHLSCAAKDTCDAYKGKRPLRSRPDGPDLPWPVDFLYERCVGFTSFGEMYVRSDAPLDEDQRKALQLAIGVPHDDHTHDNGLLNLNHPALVAARAAAVDSERKRLERDHVGETVSREARATRAEQMLKKHPLAEYVSIRVGWLTRSLGKGR